MARSCGKTDTAFYFGLYSRMDQTPEVIFPAPIPKNHELLSPYAQDENVQLLQWFTEGYYGVFRLGRGQNIYCMICVLGRSMKVI